MKEAIEIKVPIEEIARREARIVKTKRFETPDRVPVIPAINYRFLLPKIGISFRDYYSDPETMLRGQILGQKWLMENVKTATRRVIEKLGPCRGLILQDGNNISRESPLENINAMYEAVVEYGRYENG